MNELVRRTAASLMAVMLLAAAGTRQLLGALRGAYSSIRTVCRRQRLRESSRFAGFGPASSFKDALPRARLRRTKCFRLMERTHLR